jgi:hypothetical protein
MIMNFVFWSLCRKEAPMFSRSLLMTNPHAALSLTALLLALTLLIGPLVLSACGGNNSSSSRRYPPDVERNFLIPARSRARIHRFASAR